MGRHNGSSAASSLHCRCTRAQATSCGSSQNDSTIDASSSGRCAHRARLVRPYSSMAMTVSKAPAASPLRLAGLVRLLELELDDEVRPAPARSGAGLYGPSMGAIMLESRAAPSGEPMLLGRAMMTNEIRHFQSERKGRRGTGAGRGRSALAVTGASMTMRSAIAQCRRATVVCPISTAGHCASVCCAVVHRGTGRSARARRRERPRGIARGRARSAVLWRCTRVKQRGAQ